MKIGIIGLKPHQVADLRSRKLGGHTVEFLDEKAITRDRVQTFCGHHDRVILVAPNAPGPIMGFIPKEQRHVVRGGVSCIIRLISEWPRVDVEVVPVKPSVKLEDTLNVPPKPPARVEDVMLEDTTTPVPEAAKEEDAPLESTKAELREPPPERTVFETCLGSQLPDSHRARYVHPQERLPVNQPNEKGRFNYNVLVAAKEGEVVRYARPMAMAMKTWQQRVYTTRSYHKKIFGLVLEAHFYKDYVDFYVVSAGKQKTPPLRPGTSVLVRSESAVSAKPVDQAEVKTSTPAPPPIGKVGQPVFVNDFATRHFWQEAFVAGVIQGLDANAAMALADTALVGLQDRFGGKADVSK